MRNEDAEQRAPLPEPRFVPSTGDVRVATYDLGGTGGDVLMVHATGFCAGVWTATAHHLDGVGRLAALDVRGHGRSSTPAGGMDWHGTADDVLAAVDALGLERPFGVGHSMGGASLLLAEHPRVGTHPVECATTPLQRRRAGGLGHAGLGGLQAERQLTLLRADATHPQLACPLPKLKAPVPHREVAEQSLRALCVVHGGLTRAR